MARAAGLAAVVGADRVDAALGLAAIAGRFADGDLASITGHLAAERAPGELVAADEARSAQPGTSAWGRLQREGGRTVTISQPGTDTLLASQETAFIREALCTCPDMPAWIAGNGGPQAKALLAESGRTARNAAYDASLAAGYLDFPRKQAR